MLKVSVNCCDAKTNLEVSRTKKKGKLILGFEITLNHGHSSAPSHGCQKGYVTVCMCVVFVQH